MEKNNSLVLDAAKLDGELVANLPPVGAPSPATPNRQPRVATLASPMTTEINGPDGDSKNDEFEIRLFARRYLILGLFILYSMSNAFQWIEYSIITNIICNYYDVTPFSVNWTSTIYMITYIPLIFPATWLLDKKGLRFVVLIGSLGTCIGAWIKCGSLDPGRYYVTMIGQAVAAVSQIFILGIPPQLAAVWFGSKEVSRACAFGVFGNQLGIALGFVLPPMIVPNSEDKTLIASGLQILYYSVAGVTSVLLFAVIFFFRDRPPVPPSRAQALAISIPEGNYAQSIKNLVTNKYYIILLLTYGLNVGVFYAVSTLLNQTVLAHFEDKEQEAGWMGLTIILAGMMGSVVCGLILDKTHRFKETTLAVYVLTLLGMVAYTGALQLEKLWLVFILAGVLGFFMTGYLPLGFEFAAELTYPESEGTSSGLLNASAQVFGLIATFGGSYLLEYVSVLSANLCLIIMLVIGTILTSIIKADLRRLKASTSTAETSKLATA